MHSVKDIITLFARHGHKITPQRRVIFQILSDEETHPTAEEIYRRVLEVMPEVSRTTVYNTLRELVVLGVLADMGDLDSSGVRYDTNTAGHHHLFCTRCHTLADVRAAIPGPELPPEYREGFRIEKSQVMYYGVCPDCRKRETGGAAD